MKRPQSTPGRPAAVRAGRYLLPAALALLAVAGYFAGNHLRNRAHFRTAAAAESDRDFARARAELATCLTYWPDDPDVRLLAARVERRVALGDAFAEGWDRKAIAHLKAAQKARPAGEAIALEWEFLAALNGELSRVRDHLEKRAAAGGPDAPLILEVLARASLDDHRFPAAVRAASALIERQPGHALAYFWRGLAYEMTYANEELVLDDYRKALEREPDNFEFRLRLAVRLTEQQKFADALPHFRDLFARRPNQPAILLGLATCRLGLGEYDEAGRMLERLTAAEPDNGKAWAERGRAALDAGRPAEAEPLLRKGLEKAPRYAAAHFQLAQCLRQLGRAKEAQEHQEAFDGIEADWKKIREMTRRAQEYPGDAVLRCEIGLLLVRNGDPEAGAHWLQSALALDPGNDAARRALAGLREASRRGRPAGAASGRPG